MSEAEQKRGGSAPREPEAGDVPRVVAEMPEDEEMRQSLDESIRADNYPGSCGL